MGEGTETRWRSDANYMVKVEWRQAALTFSLYTMFSYTVTTANFNNPSSAESTNRSMNVEQSFLGQTFLWFLVVCVLIGVARL